MNKDELRQAVREAKRKVPYEQKVLRSATIMERLEAMPAFVNAKVVLLYWSMRDEVYTHDLVNRWYTSKTILLPCVDGDNLILRQYTGPKCLKAGEQFGIGEPTGAEYTDIDKIDLIVVPGVAFDSHRNRMGRGRGFYDRLLCNTSATKIGVAFNFQYFPSIPVDSHDIPMDYVVVE